MKEQFISAFEEVLAANQGGEVKNLLFTNANQNFLDTAYDVLCKWIVDKSFHLVEVDEECDDWICEIQSRELFFKLNIENTVLLVRNYAKIHWGCADENNPHKFLRDAALNRHYGCGNDFVPCDELPNLLFVVAINPPGRMYWDKDESETFELLRI